MPVHKSKLITELIIEVTNNSLKARFIPYMVMLDYRARAIISLYKADSSLMRSIMVFIVLHRHLCLIDLHHLTHILIMLITI